jgi:hypothetical protein
LSHGEILRATGKLHRLQQRRLRRELRSDKWTI